MRFQLCWANPQTLRASSPSRPPYERPARIRRTLIKFAHHDIDSIQTRNTSKIIRANQNRLIITVYHYHLQLNLREAHQQHQKMMPLTGCVAAYVTKVQTLPFMYVRSRIWHEKLANQIWIPSSPPKHGRSGWKGLWCFVGSSCVQTFSSDENTSENGA